MWLVMESWSGEASHDVANIMIIVARGRGKSFQQKYAIHEQSSFQL